MVSLLSSISCAISILVLLSIQQTIVVHGQTTITADLPGIKCTAPNLDITNPTDTLENQACPSQVNDLIAITMGHALNAMAYQFKWKDSEDVSPYPEFIGMDGEIKPRLGYCQSGCTINEDCAPGLHCAALYQSDLKNHGYDPLKANCGSGTIDSLTSTTTFDSMTSVGRVDDTTAVCFEPTLLARRRLGEKRNSLDMKNKLQQHRQLPCDYRCSTTCNGRPDPAACLYISCTGCRRRRRTAELVGSTTTTTTTTTDPVVMDGIGYSLAIMAQDKLREMLTWTNITSSTCRTYLETAKCTAAF